MRHIIAYLSMSKDIIFFFVRQKANQPRMFSYKYSFKNKSENVIDNMHECQAQWQALINQHLVVTYVVTDPSTIFQNPTSKHCQKEGYQVYALHDADVGRTLTTPLKNAMITEQSRARQPIQVPFFDQRSEEMLKRQLKNYKLQTELFCQHTINVPPKMARHLTLLGITTLSVSIY